MTGPKLTTCFLAVASERCYCAPAQGGEAIELPLTACDGYTAFSPDDMELLSNWMKRNCRGPK